jgi:hypothetical protein
MRALVLLFPFLILPVASGAVEWRPIEPSELTQKTPHVDPAADAEAIFWDIRVEDHLMGADLSIELHHYIRIKIFTERGKEKYATIEIPVVGKQYVTNVAARTIKPDGTAIELKKDSIFDRELLKSRNLKMRGKSFSMPNVEVGDIIEYQYKEIHDNEIAQFMRLQMQRELPMWSVTYHIKPLNVPYLPFGMRSMAINLKHPPIENEPNGFVKLSMSNVAAFEEEPYMPPEDQLRAWMLIYYEQDSKIDVEKYWKKVGRDDYASFKAKISPDGAIKRTAAELISGIEKPEDQLAALDTFCRTKIVNLSYAAAHMTAADRKAIKENHSPGDILKQKAGWAGEVDQLFAALANGAGFEARMARIPSRGDTFFTKQRPTTYFIRSFSVAVQVKDKWTFFDPATPYLERGMLRWQEEGQTALVSDPKEGFFTDTAFLEPQQSVRERRASFKLLEDGTLEGSVKYTYHGHAGRDQKNIYDDLTPAQREEDWKKSLVARLSTAELSDFEMNDAADPIKPLVVHHKVSVPGYATRTGKRMLIQPAFFERNIAPRFTGSKRRWDIYFDYPWAEDDEVIIELPEGWELDQPIAPVSSNIADLGAYSVEVRKTVDGRKLIYRRKFDFGRGLRVLLPASAYPNVKKVFDFIQEQDAYTIALKAAPDAQ